MKTKILSDFRKYRLVHFGLADAVGKDITEGSADGPEVRSQDSESDVFLSPADALPHVPFVGVKEEEHDDEVCTDVCKEELHFSVCHEDGIKDEILHLDATPEAALHQGVCEQQEVKTPVLPKLGHHPKTLSVLTKRSTQDMKYSLETSCATVTSNEPGLYDCLKTIEPNTCSQNEDDHYSKDDLVSQAESVDGNLKSPSVPASNSLCTKNEHRKWDSESLCGAIGLQCFRCELSFSSKTVLERHIITEHPGAQPFQCLHCNYSIDQKCNFKRHILPRHSTERPFQCSLCSYSSAYKIDFQRHSEKPPLQCTKCVYISAHSGNFKRHLKVRHSGVKPFQCPKCEFVLADRSHLKKHALLKRSNVGLIE